MSQLKTAFGLIVIGDEILFGHRDDAHLAYIRSLLHEHGLQLNRCYLLPDEPVSLTRHLQRSMADGIPVFVCGGIGATPDDLTRQCAARAAGLRLKRHPEAAMLIESRFGEAAYPSRIQMADLPEGCGLIPNPYNQIPGFHLAEHYFLPGFPEMAWPMAKWVLKARYGFAATKTLEECAVRVLNTAESRLVPIMEACSGRYPGLKMFSLPHLGEQKYVELGFRGEGELERAMQCLKSSLIEAGISFEQMPD